MGKNAIVGQSGGPTSVINASLAGVFESCKNRGAQVVYGMCNGVAGLLEENVVDLSHPLTDDLDIELLKRTPSSFLGSCRYKLPDWHDDEAVYKKLFAILEKLDIGYFFYIGGNDSMDTIGKLADYGNRVQSEHPLHGCAQDHRQRPDGHRPHPRLRLCCQVHRRGDEGDHPRCHRLRHQVRHRRRDHGPQRRLADRRRRTGKERRLRGRGHDLPARSALQCGPLRGEGARTMQEKKPSIVIAVSEGVKLEDGRYVCELADDVHAVDAFGHKALTGTARYLANVVARNLDTKTRSIELSTLQRCAGHLTSRTDITEAYQVGGAAAKAAFEGVTGQMVALKRISNNPYQCTTELHPISEVANLEKKVPLSWMNANHTQMTEEFLDYARPLIQAELTPLYIAGLPHHIYLKK